MAISLLGEQGGTDLLKVIPELVPRQARDNNLKFQVCLLTFTLVVLGISFYT